MTYGQNQIGYERCFQYIYEADLAGNLPLNVETLCNHIDLDGVT